MRAAAESPLHPVASVFIGINEPDINRRVYYCRRIHHDRSDQDNEQENGREDTLVAEYPAAAAIEFVRLCEDVNCLID